MVTISRLTNLLLVTVWIAALSACVYVPKPQNTDSAAIGIIIEKQWSEGGMKEDSQRIYFIRWNDSDDPIKQDDIIESNFFSGNRVYLLNAKPGRYSAVAASDFIGFRSPAHNMTAGRFGGGASSPRHGAALPVAYNKLSGSMSGGIMVQSTDPEASDGDQIDDYRAFTTYFPKDLVELTSVQVRSGEFAVMGRFQVLMHHGIRRGDKVQNYYYRLVNPSISDLYGMPILDTENSIATRAQLVKERRGPEVKRELLQFALDDLGGTPWVPLVRRNLERLR